MMNMLAGPDEFVSTLRWTEKGLEELCETNVTRLNLLQTRKSNTRTKHKAPGTRTLLHIHHPRKSAFAEAFEVITLHTLFSFDTGGLE